MRNSLQKQMRNGESCADKRRRRSLSLICATLSTCPLFSERVMQKRDVDRRIDQISKRSPNIIYPVQGPLHNWFKTVFYEAETYVRKGSGISRESYADDERRLSQLRDSLQKQMRSGESCADQRRRRSTSLICASLSTSRLFLERVHNK